MVFGRRVLDFDVPIQKMHLHLGLFYYPFQIAPVVNLLFKVIPGVGSVKFGEEIDEVGIEQWQEDCVFKVSEC